MTTKVRLIQHHTVCVVGVADRVYCLMENRRKGLFQGHSQFQGRIYQWQRWNEVPLHSFVTNRYQYIGKDIISLKRGKKYDPNLSNYLLMIFHEKMAKSHTLKTVFLEERLNPRRITSEADPRTECSDLITAGLILPRSEERGGNFFNCLNTNQEKINPVYQIEKMISDREDSRDSSKSEEEIDLFHTVVTPISSRMTIIGLLNGMVGGICLVLPQVGLGAGWGMSIFICLITGCISYYTAYLIVLHLGSGTQIKDCILSHFSNNYRYMTGYSFLIWFSFMPYMLIYFRTICLQIEGLMGHHSDYTAPLVGVGLLVIIIVVRIKHIGEETLAYGIISIIGYILFITWAQFSTPEGPKTVPTFVQPVAIASTFMMGYSIHDFLLANIIKNPDRSQYHTTVRWTFLMGTIIYTFIALGSFAIVNRTPFRQNPQTINDFFRTGEWQNSLIELVYMIHMVSAYPNFLIISKLRFFQMFKIEVQHRISWKQAIYILIVVVISYLVYITGINLQVMITLNGAVVGFTYIIAIPVWIHFKCVFYDRSSGFIENDPEWNSQIVPNGCECDNVYKNRFRLYLQTVFLILVIIMSVTLLVLTIYRNIPKEK